MHVLATVLFALALIIFASSIGWCFGGLAWLSRNKLFSDKTFDLIYKHMEAGNLKEATYLLDTAVPELYRLMAMQNPRDWYHNWNWEPPIPPNDTTGVN